MAGATVVCLAPHAPLVGSERETSGIHQGNDRVRRWPMTARNDRQLARLRGYFYVEVVVVLNNTLHSRPSFFGMELLAVLFFNPFPRQ